ncbi:hypothetical protein STEG23_009680, partial [Scotinomys teguina]
VKYSQRTLALGSQTRHYSFILSELLCLPGAHEFCEKGWPGNKERGFYSLDMYNCESQKEDRQQDTVRSLGPGDVYRTYENGFHGFVSQPYRAHGYASADAF